MYKENPTTLLSCSIHICKLFCYLLPCVLTFILLKTIGTLLKAKVEILSLIIVLMTVTSSEAHLSHGFSVIPKKIGNPPILLELQYHVLKIKYYRRMLMQGAGTQRVAPGGPDGQHH